MPWWGWLGAFCGATYVTTVFTAIPVIGTAAAVGLTVAGQQIASLFVDRYGWFRLPKREISGLRFGGVALLLIGVAIIQSLLAGRPAHRPRLEIAFDHLGHDLGRESIDAADELLDLDAGHEPDLGPGPLHLGQDAGSFDQPLERQPQRGGAFGRHAWRQQVRPRHHLRGEISSQILRTSSFFTRS